MGYSFRLRRIRETASRFRAIFRVALSGNRDPEFDQKPNRIFPSTRCNAGTRSVPNCRQKRNVPKCRLLSCGGIGTVFVGSSPTAPTTYCLRARVPQGCGLVSFTRRRSSKLRWNRSCLYRLPAYLGTISPQLRGRRLKSTQARGPGDGGGCAVEGLVDGGGHAGE